MGRYNKKNGCGRTRNWATVVYSDDSVTKLRDLHIPCFISPWHDMDCNADGERKKPHRHILMNFDSVKSEEQIRELIKEFNGVGCEYVQSNRSYGRYLCHLDNPEKAQYNINDVETIGGLDYIELINSLADEFATLTDMIDYLLDNSITSLRGFLLYCRDSRQDWFECMFRKHHLSDVKEVIYANKIAKSEEV